MVFTKATPIIHNQIEFSRAILMFLCWENKKEKANGQYWEVNGQRNWNFTLSSDYNEGFGQEKE